jgi:hypothetical protein
MGDALNLANTAIRRPIINLSAPRFQKPMVVAIGKAKSNSMP